MKKLILKKETIANLGNKELENIVGGAESGYVCSYGQNTCDGCTTGGYTRFDCPTTECYSMHCAETCGDKWTCNGLA